MYIEILARFVWALHRPTKATASTAYWNTGPLTTLQIQFEKLKLFCFLSALLLLQDKGTQLCRNTIVAVHQRKTDVRVCDFSRFNLYEINYFDSIEGRDRWQGHFFQANQDLEGLTHSFITRTHKLYKLLSGNTNAHIADW